ncbi:uncharacterized protein QC764_710550 [Podospora pseudoanserina]|uniref:TM7S3/TM198-like domain-containing protein n=1 Tax=Podospora pseudoanserina TaxID=2609844 RepID=A0ABR0HL69_9PEZI|nr:hypothetical protein QC764_710550 [Podospora pseudoanserina]
MKLAQSSGKALVCLGILAGFAAAGGLGPAKRDEVTPSTTVTPTRTLTEAGSETTRSIAPSGSPVIGTLNPSSTLPPSAKSTVDPASLFNTSALDAPLPDDQLPLQPVITPGWAVSGAIMLITGFVYAIVGIKTKWLHTFFSTAYLASLGTTALILYVMVPPVSDAVHGAYVVAAVCTGAVLGGLAIVFKELTECLAGLLGGFCLSMWLLTLQPGGLVPSTVGKVLFIASFTFSGFGVYFVPWTQIRAYALIACISFSGATVTVLGIDCFTRAGLKEFWAYIWALNDKLFPLGANTYPLTRGIRVELAVTILIFLAGIVSQLRLWRLIKDRRSKREEEIAEGERNLRIEEEIIGRQVEEMTARELRRWERIYGENTPTHQASDSALGDMDDEKRIRHSSATLAYSRRTKSPTDTDGIVAAEVYVDPLADPTPSEKADMNETVIARDVGDGRRFTVRISEDELRGCSTPEVTSSHTHDGHMRRESYIMMNSRRSSQRNSQRNSLHTPEVPILSLPFQLSNAKSEEGRSSFAATCADEEGRENVPGPRIRYSTAEKLAERLSSGSAKLLRGLSRRSAHSKRGIIEGVGESAEELAVESVQIRDDLDSLAAVLDDLSSLGEVSATPSPTTDVKMELPAWKSKPQSAESSTPGAKRTEAAVPEMKQEAETSLSSREVGDMIPEIPTRLSNVDVLAIAESHSAKPLPALEQGGFVPEEKNPAPLPQFQADSEVEKKMDPDEDSSRADPVGSPKRDEDGAKDGDDAAVRGESLDSVAASLTRGNLPPALSRVALCYRTNEWAKHLSVAEIPDPDELQQEIVAAQDGSDEEPAPLDVVDLQQTAENATIPPYAPRSASAMSNYTGQPVSRSSSRTSFSAYPDSNASAIQPGSSPDLQQGKLNGPYRSSSMTGVMLKGRNSRLVAEPIAEEGDHEPTEHVSAPFPSDTTWTMPNTNSASAVPHGLLSSTSVPNMTRISQQSLYSPPTLMGVRETLLRNKASGSIYAQTAEPIPYGIPTFPIARPSSEHESLHSHSAPNNVPSDCSSPAVGVDLDDLPLSQRRALIRQSSMPMQPQQALIRQRSGLRSPTPPVTSHPSPRATTESTTFDSHQPLRHSTIPTEAVRQAQLANFRNSVQADLRANARPKTLARHRSVGGDGFHHGPPLSGGVLNLGSTTSMTSLKGAFQSVGDRHSGNTPGSSVEAQRNIDIQRGVMMEQKEAEAARLESTRLEREGRQREFEERMRRDRGMLEAHRDAMRRIQRGVRDV